MSQTEEKQLDKIEDNATLEPETISQVDFPAPDEVVEAPSGDPPAENTSPVIEESVTQDTEPTTPEPSLPAPPPTQSPLVILPPSPTSPRVSTPGASQFSAEVPAEVANEPEPHSPQIETEEIEQQVEPEIPNVVQADPISVPPSPLPPPAPAPTPGTPDSVIQGEALSPTMQDSPILPPPVIPVEEPTQASDLSEPVTVVVVEPDDTVTVVPSDKELVELPPSDAPQDVQVIVQRPDEPVILQVNEPEMVEVVSQEDIKPVPNEPTSELVSVVVSESGEVEIINSDEEASATRKSVAFEPPSVTIERQVDGPSKIKVVEDVIVEPAEGKKELEPNRRDSQSDVPSIILAPSQPLQRQISDAPTQRKCHLDKIRQRLYPKYWYLSFKRHEREKHEQYLKPRARDRLRARLLSDCSLSMLIGRKSSAIVKPIVDEAAKTPRPHEHYQSCKWESIKRGLFTRSHYFAQRHHAGRADFHARMCKDAAEKKFQEAQVRHATRQKHHKQKALYHAEEHLRGRKRYAEQEVRAAARHTASATWHDEKLEHAVEHLKSARKSLEQDIELGKKEMKRQLATARHPVRRLEHEVENGEIFLRKIRDEINTLMKSAAERLDRSRIHDEDQMREVQQNQTLVDARQREESAQRHLAAARERLRYAKERANKESLRRMKQTRRGIREFDGFVGDGHIEQTYELRPATGSMLDGNGPSTAEFYSMHDHYGSRGLDRPPPIPMPVSTGFNRVRELSGNPAARIPGPGSSLRPRSNASNSSFKKYNTASQSSLRSHVSASDSLRRAPRGASNSPSRSRDGTPRSSLERNGTARSHRSQASEKVEPRRNRSSSSDSRRSKSDLSFDPKTAVANSQLAPSAAGDPRQSTEAGTTQGNPLRQESLVASPTNERRKSSWRIKLKRKFCKSRETESRSQAHGKCPHCPTCGRQRIYPFAPSRPASVRSTEVDKTKSLRSMGSSASVLSDGSLPSQHSALYRFKENPNELFGARSFRL